MIDTSHYDVCRETMRKHKNHFIARFLILVILLLSSIYAKIYEFVMIPVPFLGFAMGIGAILLSVGSIVCALFASPEHPKFLAVLLIVLVLGTVLGFFHEFLGVVLVFTYLTEIPECRKAKWIMQQEGYPYFNERFEEQKLHPDFHSDYALDNRTDAVMPDVEDEDPPHLSGKKKSDTDSASEMRRRRQQKIDQELQAAQITPEEMQTYSICPGETEDAMPGVMLRTTEETKEKKAAKQKPSPAAFSGTLPEPELPDAQEIPLPVWDVPDPDVPEPVTDTPVILSDFPEIAGDIPDLPEIPDIPTI